MIKYRLKCNSCSKLFDSWFSSSLEYEKLKNKEYLCCHFCNSKDISKSIMAPNLLSSNLKEGNKTKKKQEIKKKFLEFQKFIKNHFEYVGDDFAYKARSLHYNSKKNIKGIYGNATKEEIADLNEEGIETELFPWIDDRNN